MRQLFPTENPHIWAQYLQALKRLKRRCVNDGAIKTESRRSGVPLVRPHNCTSILLSHPGTRIVTLVSPGNYKYAITD